MRAMTETSEFSLSNGDTITIQAVRRTDPVSVQEIVFWEASLEVDTERYRGFGATTEEAIIDLYRTKQLDEFEDEGRGMIERGWVDEASG